MDSDVESRELGHKWVAGSGDSEWHQFSDAADHKCGVILQIGPMISLKTMSTVSGK